MDYGLFLLLPPLAGRELPPHFPPLVCDKAVVLLKTVHKLSKFPLSDNYPLCLLCLGEVHRMDSCLHYTRFSKQDRKKLNGSTSGNTSGQCTYCEDVHWTRFPLTLPLDKLKLLIQPSWDPDTHLKNYSNTPKKFGFSYGFSLKIHKGKKEEEHRKQKEPDTPSNSPVTPPKPQNLFYIPDSPVELFNSEITSRSALGLFWIQTGGHGAITMDTSFFGCRTQCLHFQLGLKRRALLISRVILRRPWRE